MNRKPEMILTPRLRLGPITEADTEAILALLTNEEIGRTYMVPDFTCREDVLRVFQAFRRLSHSDTRFVYGIYRENILVGLINDVGIEDTAIELGYVIHPDHKNRGYATEVLAAAMDTLFAMGFTVVKTGAFPENLPSIRVMEKCGMVRLAETETVEYRGRVHHCVLFEKRSR